MHGYYERKINNGTQIDIDLSNYWKKDKSITSKLEKYLSIIHDQKLSTEYLRNKIDGDSKKPLIAEINADCVLPTL